MTAIVSFNSLPDDLSRGSYELGKSQFCRFPASIKLNDALGNRCPFLVICCVCERRPQ
jgi:hypothetical protein